jgi:GT2 family glycosyltransferase
MDLVSVIIVNYNGKKWLQKCLDSLLNQTYTNFEIILVDNKSTDDSIKFLKTNYLDKRLKIIEHKENSGFSGGNNIGIESAKGEYILLLNNDTWVDSDFLEKIMTFYKNNKYDIVAPYENDYEDTKHPQYSIQIDILGHPMYDRQKNDKADFYLSGVSLLFRKDFYLETKGLDNNFFMYFEEIDWFWRVMLLGGIFRHIPNLYVHHAGSGSTGSGIKYLSFLWRNQNTLQMLIKNYSWYNLIWVLPIYILQNLFEIIFMILIFQPKIAFSYIQGWYFNIIHLPRTLQERKWVQKNRKISDAVIMNVMYKGFAKFHHLLVFFKIKSV